VHLLMALVETKTRCDGLWPLLTLGRASWSACVRCWMRSRMSVRMQQEAELARSEVEFVGVRSVLNKGRGN
jgi:hypothetical protein